MNCVSTGHQFLVGLGEWTGGVGLKEFEPRPQITSAAVESFIVVVLFPSLLYSQVRTAAFSRDAQGLQQWLRKPLRLARFLYHP